MNELQWVRNGDVWQAPCPNRGWRYKIRMLKDGNYSVIVLGRPPLPASGNHLGYYGLLDEAAAVCEIDSKKGATNE